MNARRNPRHAISRRLIDRFRFDPKATGEVQTLVATTYDLDPDFFEHDFLPTVLGVANAEDSSFSGRIALQRKLAACDFCGLLLDAGAYQGRPSLRTIVRPIPLQAKLHAKIIAVGYEQAIRIAVGSANLTTPGYRHNREVAAVLEISAEHTEDAAAAVSLLQQARAGIARIDRPEISEFLPPLDSLAARARRWSQGGPSNPAPLWSDVSRPLMTEVVSAWPDGAPVERLTLVSPFWSETGTRFSPLRHLLQRLSDSHKLADHCRVELYLDATRLEDGGYQPAFPAGFTLHYDDLPGVEVVAFAVDPSVDPADLDVKIELTAARVLHAKMAVLQGAGRALVYAGSANFTGTGWGVHHRANAEAGYLWHTDSDTARSLLPATAAGPLPIGSGKRIVPAITVDEPPPYWPAFLTNVALRPADDDDALELAVTWNATAPSFELRTVPSGSEPAVQLVTASRGPGTARVPLPPPVLNQLLVEREVVVRERGTDKEARYPVNLAPGEARLRLPLAPNAAKPGEDALVAYYQGRVPFEALFPEPGTEGPDVRPGPHAVIESGVDTSKIQSYQVRALVEALTGIQQELERSRGPRSLVEFTYLGPVSPVALASAIVEGVVLGSKSPTAGAFELLELEQVAAKAAGKTPDDSVVQAVAAIAQRRIAAARKKVEAISPTLFASNSAFHRYEQAVGSPSDSPSDNPSGDPSPQGAAAPTPAAPNLEPPTS